MFSGARTDHPSSTVNWTGPVSRVLVIADIANAAEQIDLDAATIGSDAVPTVIALPWPRMAFTVDAAIARRFHVRRAAALRELEELAVSQFFKTGKSYTVIEIPYRWSRHPVRRERRIAAALDRFVQESRGDGPHRQDTKVSA